MRALRLLTVLFAAALAATTLSACSPISEDPGPGGVRFRIDDSSGPKEINPELAVYEEV